MFLKARQVDQELSLELTPLIDMVFLLLIFFLVATTFHQEEREMQIALPVATSAGPISALLQELVVNVDEEGHIIIGGRRVEPQSLRSMIAEAVANATVVGDPRGDGVEVGPLVSELQWNKVQGLIQDGIDEGATLAAGGVGKALEQRAVVAGRPELPGVRHGDRGLQRPLHGLAGAGRCKGKD